MIDSLQVMIEAIPVLLQGLWLTFLITVISLSMALVIGVVFGILAITPITWVQRLVKLYVDVVRGTPILVQILFIYIGLPTVTNLTFSALTAGIIAITINAGAYLVEVFRAGIYSIDKGQMEAGRTLGLSYGETMRFIILPQAVQRMIPAIVNQFIISIKDTSLLSVIGIAELTMSGQSIYSNNFRAFEILFMVGLFYFALIHTLTILSRKLERRLDVA